MTSFWQADTEICLTPLGETKSMIDLYPFDESPLKVQVLGRSCRGSRISQRRRFEKSIAGSRGKV